MKKITFNAHRGDAIISRLIRVLSPQYNHISIQLGHHIYEAHIDTGVRKVRRLKWDDTTVVDTISIFCEDEHYQETKDFLEKQVGKKYDILGIVGFIWVFTKPRIGRWYCSELAQVILYKANGISSSEEDYTQKVSPFAFWRTLQLLRANNQ